LSRALAAAGDDRTAPPKYNGSTTAASSAGILRAVNGFGATVVDVVGAVADFLELEEHPLNTRTPARTVDTATDTAGDR
jgi:hypothetical protein